MEKKDKLPAVLAGAGSAVAFWWKATEQDFSRRLRELRTDRRDLQTRLNHLLASGDWLRMQVPLVRDALVGMAAASLSLKPPAVAPQPWTVASRPDLTSPATVAGWNWPPSPGRYDATGRAQSPGEWAQTFFALTYEEPRIVLQALTQSQPPSSDAKLQLFYAFQALSRTITGRSLTLPEWEAVWARLFDADNGCPTVPSVRPFTGETNDATPKILGEIQTAKDGIYKVHALCGMQRDDGTGGSLNVYATYSKFKGGLSLVGSARLSAQLNSALVGVDASFDASADLMQLRVTGKSAMKLTWDNHVTIYTPT